MKNILVGNGINIRYDNVNYTARNIVQRLLTELDSPEFPWHYIIDNPLLLKHYMGKLFLASRQMIDGDFDKFTNCSAEVKALKDFKERYKSRKKSLRIADIGFEDYYLVHDLICHRYRIINPELYTTREVLKMAYFHSIYNYGRLNLLYKNYSESFKSYLLNFDNIFTTNYDSNIELATGKRVYHIHGQFDRLSEVYNPKSFRNQLKDNPLDGIPNDIEYTYLHSTAVSTYCGDYKQYYIKQNYLANEAIEKLSTGYLTMESVQTDVDSWEYDDNKLVANLANAIKVKITNQELRFQEDYSINELSNMTGYITILGLSPYNDYHLFEMIDNADMDNCIYYYFNSLDRERIEGLFPKLKSENKLTFKCVKEFWEVM